MSAGSVDKAMTGIHLLSVCGVLRVLSREQAVRYKARADKQMAASVDCTGLVTLPSCLQALRRKAKAGDKTAALELADEDELFRNRGDAAQQELQQRHKVRRVDPTVNLAADSFDQWSHGFGLDHDPAKVTHASWTSFPCTQGPAQMGCGKLS